MYIVPYRYFLQFHAKIDMKSNKHALLKQIINTEGAIDFLFIKVNEISTKKERKKKKRKAICRHILCWCKSFLPQSIYMDWIESNFTII